jgi:hypothetical protein
MIFEVTEIYLNIEIRKTKKEAMIYKKNNLMNYLMLLKDNLKRD